MEFRKVVQMKLFAKQKKRLRCKPTNIWTPRRTTGWAELEDWIDIYTLLDSMLKSRDITLPTKAHLVKAMVFPVVMYGCESWTVKKAERRRIDDFELWCWRRLLRVP